MRLVPVVAVVAFAVGCEVGKPPIQGSAGAQGQAGSSFSVLVGKAQNGTVTSADGRIRCGSGGDACTAEYPWSASVILTATPDAGYALQTWAGDCTQPGDCVLDTNGHGADKYVLPVFNPLGQLGHANWTSPDLHAPAYREFLAGAPAALQCTTCHGATLQGQGLAVSCDACHATNGYGHWKAGATCTTCHGDATRIPVAGADPLVSAAPPVDTRGNVTRGTRGVGAHEAHVNGAARPVACAACHVVPTSTSHADGVATVTFGALATNGGAAPLWNGASCSATYCHGATLSGGSNTVPIWISGPSQATCGSCHGVPPPPPHTASTSCGDCHPGYTSTTVDPATHVNGAVDVASALACGSCHGIPPASHGSNTTCGNCHDGYTPTSVNPALHQNGTVDVLSAPACGSCHGIPPPAPHVTSTACETCHSGYTSTTVNPALHQNGTVDVLALSCDSCHGTPPSTGQHLRSNHVSRSCGDCHPGYTSSSANTALHQNGTSDTGNGITSYDRSSRTCTSTCHGSEVW